MNRWLRLAAKQYRHELAGYAADVVTCCSRRINFLILSGGRRGSHLLIDLINSHPHVHCDSELLHPGRVRRRIPFLWSYLRGHKRGHGSVTYGFKLSLNQLRLQTDPKQFLSRFHTSGGKIIYLQLTDLLRAAISSMIARQRGRYHDRSANPLDGMAFQIDADELLQRLRRRVQTNHDEAEILREISHLPICYESDLLPGERQQAATDRVFDLLEVKRISVQTDLHRTSPSQLSTINSNYDQLIEHIRQSDLSHLVASIVPGERAA